MKMFLFLITLIQFSFANEVTKAFEEFYDNDIINFRLCGQNTHNFLKYLDEKGIKYNSAHVVSMHEPALAGVRHFDARWGKTTKYQNGESFEYSNWYFHVFAIIDGYAYDFSQGGMKAQRVKDYFETAYLPKYDTEKLLFTGVITKEKMFKEYKNMKLLIHDAKGYAKDYGPVIYEGTVLEYFNYLQGVSNEYSNEVLKYNVDYFDSWVNADNSVTILNPTLTQDGSTYPLIADGKNICRAFGYLGTVDSKLEYHVDDTKTQKAFKLSSSFLNSKDRVIKTSDIYVRAKIDETMVGIPHQPLFHVATKVVCSDLVSVLSNL